MKRMSEPTSPHAAVDDSDDPASVAVWESLVLAVHLLDSALEQQAQRDGGISHGQFKILVLLSAAPDRTLGLSQLAEQLRFSLSRLSHAVTTLGRRGLVHRRPIPEGRRAYEATLTADGTAVVARVLRAQRTQLRDPLIDAIDVDAAELVTLTRRVIATLDQLNGAG